MALAIDTLTSSLSPWEDTGYVATGIVITGCIGESIVEFTKWIKDERNKSLAGRISAFILIAGLALEVLAQVKVNSISGQIIALLNNQTAEARAETARVQTAVAWRIIPNDQYIELAHLLEKGRGSVTIGWIANDPESMYFAWQLSYLFEQVGAHVPNSWTVRIDARSYSQTFVRGVFVPGPDSPATEAIRSAFTAARLPFSTNDVPAATYNINNGLAVTDPIPTTDAFVMVGSKPPPPISFSLPSTNSSGK